MAFAPASPLTLDGLNKFLSMTYHHMMHYAIYTFADLRLADRLINAPIDRGFTIEEILGDNDQQQWNSQVVNRILRACIYGGLVKLINDDKHFILTESGIMMTSDHSSHVRDFIVFAFGPINTGSYLQLPNIARNEGTGSGIARISNGLNIYELMSQPDQKELLSTFSGTMKTLSSQSGTKLVTGVDFSRFKTMVDTGGNRGAFLAEILQHYPMIQHGIVFDLPHIVNQFNHGEDFQTRQIHKDRWSFVSGNMFDSSTIPLGVSYVLKHILHNFNDEKYIEILSSIRQANQNRTSSSVSLFIVEYVILPDGALSNWQTHSVDIAMAALFDNSRERTEDEHKELLKKSGFEFKKLYPIQAPESIIEAVLIDH